MDYIETIADIAKLITSITIIAGGLWTVFTFLKRQKEQDVEIKNMKAEQQVMCFGMLACLDGLKQLGANGNVTTAHECLEKHINKAAHRE